MTTEPDSWFSECISALTYSPSQRVWSIIVTLFGDLARHPDDTVSGALLTGILDPAGLRPEAIRVALHRLRNEGWITSQRKGRGSLYQLTQFGMEESAAASPRIYARSSPDPGPWHVALMPPMAQNDRAKAEVPLLAAGYLAMLPGVYLGKGSARDMPSMAVLAVPEIHRVDWLAEKFAPPQLMAHYKALELALDQTAYALGARDVPPLMAATIRVLIVHNWRRTLLSHADLPEQLFPAQWRGDVCRSKVVALLDRLGRPGLEELGEAVGA